MRGRKMGMEWGKKKRARCPIFTRLGEGGKWRIEVLEKGKIGYSERGKDEV